MVTKADIRKHARNTITAGLALIQRGMTAPDLDHDIDNLVLHLQGPAPTAELNLGSEEDLIPFEIWGDDSALATWYDEADRVADLGGASVETGRYGGTDVYIVMVIWLWYSSPKQTIRQFRSSKRTAAKSSAATCTCAGRRTTRSRGSRS